MLTRQNLNIEKFTQKKSQERSSGKYDFSSILIEPRATVATNGYVLVWVSRPKTNDTLETEHFCIDPKLAHKVVQSMPPKPKSDLERLASITRVEQDITIKTNNNPPGVYTQKQVTDEWPEYARCIPTTEAVAQVTVNASYLANIAKFFAELAEKHLNTPVTLSVYSDVGQTMTLRFDGQSHDDLDQRATAILRSLSLEAITGYGGKK